MIHRVYRLLAQRYHPDNGDNGDDTAFRAITEAYKTLSDPEKRAAYDVNLHSSVKSAGSFSTSINPRSESCRGITELLYSARTDNGRFSGTAKGVDWAETKKPRNACARTTCCRRRPTRGSRTSRGRTHFASRVDKRVDAPARHRKRADAAN